MLAGTGHEIFRGQICVRVLTWMSRGSGRRLGRRQKKGQRLTRGIGEILVIRRCLSASATNKTGLPYYEIIRQPGYLSS